jgi:two-component system, chemotaxis family, sensor kinase CheA
MKAGECVGFKKKQYMGLGLTIFFLFLLLSIILVMMNSIKANMLEIVVDRYYKVNETTTIRQELYKKDRDLILLITEGVKEDVLDPNVSASDEKDINEIILNLETKLNRNKSKVLINEVKQSYQQYAVMETEIKNQLADGAGRAELQAIYNENLAARDVLFSKIDEFKNFQESLMNSALKEATATYDGLVEALVVLVSLAILIIAGVILWVIRGTVGTINSMTSVIKKVDYKDLSAIPRIQVKTKDEFGEIAQAYNTMAASIEELTKKEKIYSEEIEEQNWIESHSVEIVKLYSKHVTVAALAEQFIQKLTPLMGGSLGAFYIKDDSLGKSQYKRIASYADGPNEAGRVAFVAGEGLIGQCAAEKRTVLLQDVPADYRVISTGLGNVVPKNIIMAPVLMKDEVVAVIEIASIHMISPTQQKLLENILETLGIGITNIIGRMEVERLLLESQAQAEELQAQAEELQSQSEELQAQSEELQMQTEELRITNEQLEERSRDAELKSEELQAAKEDLEQKAKELQQSSKYKSEFLANMSHELRTPLNSILLLSEMLADDQEYGLSEEQKEFTRVIHSSGQDLLNLINDILDLSKVEAGKLEVNFEEVYLVEFIERLERNFSQIAKSKRIDFNIALSETVSPIIYTDEQRLQQILKNLLSNAFKFTEQGSVSISIDKADAVEIRDCPLAGHSDTWVKFTVTDTGIGVPLEKQNMIFEAFQQVDGAIMRKYGGTGLGLSISKEFSQLLGGMCKVESEEGKGSTFTIFIPNLPDGHLAKAEIEIVQDQVAASIEQEVTLPETALPETLNTDSPFAGNKAPTVLSGKTVVVVDDDHRNIFTLKNLLRKEDMNVRTAENGAVCLELMNENEHVDIVLMDIMMPVMDGYETIKHIRNMENKKSETPIIALTAKAMKGDRDKCLEAGANDYISKPMKLDQLLSAMRVWLS